MSFKILFMFNTSYFLIDEIGCACVDVYTLHYLKREDNFNVSENYGNQIDGIVPGKQHNT